jgi:AcrR family transcriptional regulator
MTELTSRSATRARIVAAAARLLADAGPSAVTTRAVADGAGVQAPTIYRLFGDKDGLLEAVTEHVLAAHVADKAAVVAAASAEEVDPLEDLEAGWDAQIAFGLANPTLFGLLSDPARGPRSPAAQSGQRVLRARVHRVATAGRLRVSEERAVGLIQAAGTGVVLTLLGRPAEQRDLGLAQEAYEAVLRQILTDAADADVTTDRGGSPKAAVVACRASADTFEVLTPSERQLLGEWLDRVIAEL